MQGLAEILHVDDGGSGGVPVLFVESFAGDTTSWTAQLKHLRETLRAISLGLRGDGQKQAAEQGQR